MASVYPANFDDFTNPSPSDSLDSSTVPHAQQHSDINDAVEAIEATLGINPQGDAPTVGDRVAAVETAAANISTLLGPFPEGAYDDVTLRLDAMDSSFSALESGVGTAPFGGALFLTLDQISASESDQLVAGEEPGEVDDSAPVGYVKIFVAGTYVAFPVFAIVPAE
jgi:hypothetical protein